uniref:Uncharacterized protein n=1 Tax=Aegilops tauschii subsp. strangulata TaxID=200361 RepID=A0A453EAW0_AEGTS
PCARAAAAGGGAKWWAPLLGWSGQPDYIEPQPAAEPARQLRLRMMETESFHDVMYHSAIASRLASAPP